MILEKKLDGTVAYTFYRKHFKKARFLRWAERQKRYLDKQYPGWHGMIIWT
jgi:hypothetical protein